MSWSEVTGTFVKRTLEAMKRDYDHLEKETTEIVYPEVEKLPLVAIGPVRKVYEARRMQQDTILNQELASRRLH